LALGGLGWTLRRIEVETTVRRETPGIAIRPPGRWAEVAARTAQGDVDRLEAGEGWV
jgi:hypothetical protein